MATLDPVDYDLVHEVKTKNIASGTGIQCKLKWKENYPAGFESKIQSSGSVCDSRALDGSRYEADGTTSGSAKTDVDHSMSWPSNTYVNTNEMEIFAVIRAEYRFICDNSWEKKMSKKGAQGIDSLFYRQESGTNYWAVVESKCTSKVKDYSKYLKGGNPLSRLGTANPKVKYKGTKQAISTSGVTQMTEPWIYHAFLQETAGKPNPIVMGNLTEWYGDIAQGCEPHKWLNVYGTDIFHMVPGVYKSSATITGKSTKQNMEDIEVDWPDDHYREYEFFALTTTTDTEAHNGLVSGAWWDISTEFEKLCDDEKKQIDQKKYDTMMDVVDDEFG